MPKTHLAGILEERDLIYEKSGPKMSQIWWETSTHIPKKVNEHAEK